jgi:hypothetical protein
MFSAPELQYCGVMNHQPGPASKQQPRVILTTPRLILRTATEPDIPVMRSGFWVTPR